MSTIAPLVGWMLDTVAANDEHQPGFAGHYLRASNERRQVIAAYFAVVSNGDAGPKIAANFLAQASHQNILRRAFEHLPMGIRRALAKSGSQPHDPAYYRDLYEALAFGLQHVVAAIMSADLPPGGPSIITRVLRLNIPPCSPAQARRA